MSWQFTDDVQTYAQQTWAMLAAHPAQNTVALTVIENVRAGRRWSPEPMLFGWYEAPEHPLGAFSMTPPYGLLLADVAAFTVEPLVEALLARGVEVTGVNGETSVAEGFVTAWIERRPTRAVPRRHERLYRLQALLPPSPTRGQPRVADAGDVSTAVDWFTRFQVEAGAYLVDVEPAVRDRVENGLLWLWEDDDGRLVSMAGRNRTTAGVARVGPVYTPPEHRRRGFGAAITAACTRDALTRDAHEVVLFTDLSNATSNAIYQQIGYHPLRDHLVVDFLPP